MNEEEQRAAILEFEKNRQLLANVSAQKQQLKVQSDILGASLEELKNTKEFIDFVNRFRIFVDLMQKLSTNYSRLSEKSILLIKQEILTKFNAEYRLGLKFISMCTPSPVFILDILAA